MINNLSIPEKLKFKVLKEVLTECLDDDVIEESLFYWILSYYRHKYGILLGIDERKELGI